jgi:hypothetical protein
MKKLDWKKIEQFEKEIAAPSGLGKKYGFPVGWKARYEIGWTHTLYALKAHARGKIHARNIAKICTYAPGVPREKGSGIHYKLLSKTYKLTISTLEEQADLFFGPKFLAQFEAAPVEVATTEVAAG